MNELQKFTDPYNQLSSMVDSIPDIMLEALDQRRLRVVVCANWVRKLLADEEILEPGTVLPDSADTSQLLRLAREVCQQQQSQRNTILQIHDQVLVVLAQYFAASEENTHPLVIMRLHDITHIGYNETARKYRSDFFGIIGKSSAMVDIFRRIELYSKTHSNILITGETGTGKELVAQAIHQLSRFRGEFVALNCTALSDTLIESELFGHERGAFTGAHRTHRGKFERADHGTLFLDEIGDMPLHTQGKLLRVLEDGMVERVGGESTFPVDVRIVAATNVPLEQAIQEKRFRADLFYRLAVLRIHIPPLRQRREDIPLLVRHFISRLNQKYASMGKRVLEISSEAMAIMTNYTWPGNVRELSNVIERIFIETPSAVITAEAMRSWVEEKMRIVEEASCRPPLDAPRQISDTAGLPLGSRNIERQHIVEALAQAGGNKTQAARLLGVDKSTLYRKMKRFAVQP
ncbi:sigma-54 factor interaction domain-containing protein [Desulfurispirillum indicum S5]|uniref:Sigma-54 factor interaction domain-containing protein n=1 Tax=Desulfurispirillum indicum (strain ATCC BAA-1389 / DSM 22839 / S5) TaxID=653733 RepID=E6W318_DESIS|nr:sigma-54 dependent transcriptional regulator [Desulfurispirillum indicum]ADU65679.1 sigma-54 factor interaction domain-containing protein [Desulfurispirillum indicum S5]